MAKYKKKSYRRKRKFKKKSTGYNIVKTPNAGLPAKFSMKHRYVWTGAIDPAIGGLATNRIFRANGMFDPDTTAGGNQPRFYDQMQALYDHFTVIGSKITVRMINTDTTHAVQCWITTRDSITSYTTPVDNTENAHCTSAVLGPKGSSKDQCTLTTKCNPAKFLGLASPMSEFDLRGNAAADPLEQVLYHVGVADLNGSDDPLPVEMYITIDYIAVWTEIIQPGQS